MRRVVLFACVPLAACGGGSGGSSTAAPPASVEDEIRAVAHAQGLQRSPVLAELDLTPAQHDLRELRRGLGHKLFFDKIMSGVEMTSCATCHHAAFQFGDGRNIARGVFCDLTPRRDQIICRDAPTPGLGGNVVGPDRTSPLNSRNSPLLINAALFPKYVEPALPLRR